MKLVIFGSRDAYPSPEYIDAELHRLFIEIRGELWRGLGPRDITEVVCGTARGADRCGEEWALHNTIPIKFFPANWERDGKRAGHDRNRVMAEYADIGLGFWKKESGGTANMTTQLVVLGKPVRVVRV